MQDTIGIDISKDTLDVHRQSNGKHARFGNDKAGLTAPRRWIGNAPVRVVYEATGRYHRDMEATLDAAGHALVKVNPGRARRFAQAAGCGERARIGEDISERPDAIAARFRVLVTRRPRYACRRGAQAVAQAPAPEHVVPGGLPTGRLVAWVMVPKVGDHLPVCRQAGIFERQGIDRDRGPPGNRVGRACFQRMPVIGHALAHGAGLIRFLDDGTIEPDTSPVEDQTARSP